jgi:DeoR/GlpR family transcriptional regulator of sugar metabolism
MRNNDGTMKDPAGDGVRAARKDAITARHDDILNYLQQSGAASVGELQEATGWQRNEIKSSLTALALEGKLIYSRTSEFAQERKA